MENGELTIKQPRKMRRLCIGLVFALSIVNCQLSIAQKYWISFADKNGTTFNPTEYFDPRTIEQRLRWNIPVADSLDFPVNEKYLSEVRGRVSGMSHESRWLNGVAVFASREQIQKIKKLAFVKDAEEMAALNVSPILSNERADEEALNSNETAAFKKNATIQNVNKRDLPLLQFQTQRLHGEKFREKKIDGTGIRIALFDGGFPSVNKHPAFEHLFRNKRIIATYDFIKNKEDVFAANAHGAATLSCIAGIADTINIGLATGAEFLLARTERAYSESFSEEENWLAAAEWADKHGANIISSSLGYTYHRYFTTDMDGKQSLVARAANIAASKGILVVNAAGNEGIDETWRYIATPADADSVLAVGGTDPYTDYHIGFSSYGPTSDGRLKPNVCALGNVIVATPNGYAEQQGTSFSAPMVAGFAACAWQLHRDWNCMKLLHEIEKSAHLYPYFDYAHGYGIPQAGYFTDPPTPQRGDLTAVPPTFYFLIVNSNLTISLDEKYAHPDMEEFLGYKPIRNLYYRVDGSAGEVKFYAVVLAEEKEVLQFSTEQFKAGDKISVHFEGYTSSYTITGEENPPSPVDEK